MNKLSNEEIKKIIEENYGILYISGITEIDRGTADIYLIETENKKLVFKYFQDKYFQTEINREISIINFLCEREIPTPKYLTTIKGEYSIVYNDRVVILQDYIEGTTKEKNIGDEKEMLDSAMYLGKIVKALEDYDHEFEFNGTGWFLLDSDEVINKNKELLDSLNLKDVNAIQIEKDLNKKIEIADKLRGLNTEGINKVNIKFTHGDYSVMQFIYEEKEIKAILDFVSACDMPIVWEIIRSYSYIDENCIDGRFNIDNLIKYVKQFQKYVELNKYDLKYMPYIYLIQLLKSTFGYKQYINTGNKEILEFGILRTQICDYLYEHFEEISTRLLDEIDYEDTDN